MYLLVRWTVLHRRQVRTIYIPRPTHTVIKMYILNLPFAPCLFNRYLSIIVIICNCNRRENNRRRHKIHRHRSDDIFKPNRTK